MTEVARGSGKGSHAQDIHPQRLGHNPPDGFVKNGKGAGSGNPGSERLTKGYLRSSLQPAAYLKG